MGTADYCLIVVVLFFSIVALTIKREEQRKRDARQRQGPPPNGIERRSGKDRREGSWSAYAAWVGRSLRFRAKKLF